MFHHIAVPRLPARVLLSDARQFPNKVSAIQLAVNGLYLI